MMNLWSDAPRPGMTKNTFDIHRTPAKGHLKLHLTCDKAIGRPIHFWGGRSVPCLQSGGCEPCEKGRDYRWKCYVSAIHLGINDHVIYECTAPIHDRLHHAYLALGSIRGLKISTQRVGGSPCGRILMVTATSLDVPDNLPEAPDVAAVMEHVWARCLDVHQPKNARKDHDTLPLTG